MLTIGPTTEIVGEDKPIVHIEIGIRPSHPVPLEQLRLDWLSFLQGCTSLSDLEELPEHLQASLAGPMKQQILDEDGAPALLPPNAYELFVHPYILHDDEPAVEELEPGSDGDEWTAACDSWSLPHTSLQGLWESLLFEENLGRDLLEYARSALLFADRGISNHIVHWNRLLLLHGPPGTGKTSLCRSLAHKLSIRLGHRFARTTLLEIHSHSLFSKWFSTSGKLIHRLFDLVKDMVTDDPEALTVVLIDEIESLAGSRQALGSGGEPSDALRAVNSLLTSLDRLRVFPNVLILATTNLTDAVDEAFLDRADLQVYVPTPCLEARYEILRTCLLELMRVGLVVTQALENYAAVLQEPEESTSSSTALLQLAAETKGESGRSLRRLPLQAHALFIRNNGRPVVLTQFLYAIRGALQHGQREPSELDESDI